MTESVFFDKEELSAFLSSQYQYCDHSDSDGFTISVSVSGASGGNCWGDYAQNFRKDSDEIADEIQSESFYRIKDYLSAMNIDFSENELSSKVYDFAREIQDSEYDTSHESEYYGNYTNYNKYFISINDILNLVEIDQEKKDAILLVSQEVQDKINSEKDRENKYQQLIKIKNQIEKFDDSSASEKKQLENNLKRALTEVESLKNKLANIEKNQSKQLKSLKEQEKTLTDFLGDDYINSHKKNKRRY